VFYHVFAHLGYYDIPGVCDLESEEEVITSYYIPFLTGDVFTINGKKLLDKNIKRLQVFKTQETVGSLIACARPLHSGKPAYAYKAITENPQSIDITNYIDKKAKERTKGQIKMSSQNPGNTSIHIERSAITNSPITTGIMDHFTQTIYTINKPEIEDWLRQIKEELGKNHIQQEEMTSAMETLQAAIQASKPNRTIIKAAVDTVRAIGCGIVSSAAWQSLMTRPPI
jgi:hypothetical protein